MNWWMSFVECFTFTLSTQLNGFLFVLNKRIRVLWAALCHPFICLPFTNSDKSMTLSDIVQLTETENRLHISTSFLVISSMKLNDHCYVHTAQHTFFFVHNSQRMQSDCCYYSEINDKCCVYCAAWYCAAHQCIYTFMSLFCIDHFFYLTFFLLSYFALLCLALFRFVPLLGYTIHFQHIYLFSIIIIIEVFYYIHSFTHTRTDCRHTEWKSEGRETL